MYAACSTLISTGTCLSSWQHKIALGRRGKTDAETERSRCAQLPALLNCSPACGSAWATWGAKEAVVNKIINP